jgi:hypothetical protein
MSERTRNVLIDVTAIDYTKVEESFLRFDGPNLCRR